VYDKVFSRALILMSVLGLYPLARALELNRDDLGLNGFEPRFVAWGWLTGMILMLPPIALMFWVRFRHVDPRLEPEYLDYALTFARFLVSAGLIGIIEELLFRGLLHALLLRVMGFSGAALVGSALYASVHFLELPDDVPVITDPGWFAGIGVLWAGLQPLLSPAEYWDSFVALWLLGLGFCWVRRNAGHIWVCVGLHAGFVFTLKILKELTVRDVVNPNAWIVGSYDHFVGHAISAWILLLMLTMLCWRLWLERSGRGAHLADN